MSQNGVLVVREETSLALLKGQLGISTSSPLPSSAYDAFLLRFLRSCELNTTKTVSKLIQRREYEKSLPSVCVTPGVVHMLRSGAFSVIGEDHLHRPVLHIRMGPFRPTTGSKDAERLLILLLEYMQSLTMRHHSGDNGEYIPSSVQNRINSTPLGAASVANQEFTILVSAADETVISSASNGVGRRAQLISKISSLAAKYYPGLIGSILMVDASWASKQGVRMINKANQTVRKGVMQLGAGGENSASRALFVSDENETSGIGTQTGADELLRQVVVLVPMSQLPRFLDVHRVLPEDLGGRKGNRFTRSNHTRCVEATNDTDFCQLVSRHWFNTVSFLIAEESAASTRPLWQTTPFAKNALSRQVNILLVSSDLSGVLSSSSYSALARVTTECNNRGIGDSGQSAYTVTGSGPPSVISGRHRSFTGRRRGSFEDGVCSVMTDPDAGEDLQEDNIGAMCDVDKSHRTGDCVNEVIIAELDEERKRRIQLENELSHLTLGITLDESTLTKLEVNLKVAHSEVNVLISETIQTIKAMNVGIGGSCVGPSLQQLLEATDKAILQAIRERQPAAAITAFAQPHERSKRRKCIIM